MTAHRRPQLTPLQRYRRGKQIASLRARDKPVAWKLIAKEVGMSEGGAKEAYAQFLDWELPEHDLMRPVDETIEVLTVTIHEALETYQAAPEGSSVRVQALKTASDVAQQRLTILRQAGRAPRSLQAPAFAMQIQMLFRRFAELLERHQVSEDAARELVALAESTSFGPDVVEGRELPSAA